MVREIEEHLIENNKEFWFVKHIQNHLSENEEVICKICGKSVDTIAKEILERIKDEIQKGRKR